MDTRQEFAGLVRFLFQTRFPPAEAAWLDGFLSLLMELRRIFGNDLDKIIILSMIGQQMLLDPRVSREGMDEWVLLPLAERRGKVANLDALARATGIPRESVRRKVNELIAAGLVQNNGPNSLSMAPGAAARLVNSTEISVGMLDTVVATYLAMMVESELLSADRLLGRPATDLDR